MFQGRVRSIILWCGGKCVLSVRLRSVQFIDDLEMLSDADTCLLLDSDCRTPMRYESLLVFG